MNPKPITLGDIEAAFLYGWDAGYGSGTHERLRVGSYDLDECRARDSDKYMAALDMTTTADPAPMPEPALGMCAWYSRPLSENGGRESARRSVDYIRPDLTWRDLVGEYRIPDIDLITDFRTGEVIWRRA